MGAEIAYIGGGSRGWAEVVHFQDIGYDAAKRNEEFGNWVQDRDEALGGADFVVLSIQPGRSITWRRTSIFRRDTGFMISSEIR